MRFESAVDLHVPVETVWNRLWDVERLARYIPGVEDVVEVTAREAYRARVVQGLGPFRLRLDLDIKVGDVVEKEQIRLSIEGQDRRIGSSMQQSLQLNLTPAGPDRTELRFLSEMTMRGRLAALGQGLVERKAREIADQFVANLRQDLEGGKPDAAAL